jgi:hypothetical protein
MLPPSLIRRIAQSNRSRVCIHHRTGFSENNDNNDSDNDDDDALAILYAYFLGYAVLMSIVVLAFKLLHDRPRTIGAILPEAGLIILCGMLAGGGILLWEQLGETNLRSRLMGAPESLLIFSPNVFFVGLLPPIICTYSKVCLERESSRREWRKTVEEH